MQHFQGLLAKVPPSRLAQTADRWVNGRQRVLQHVGSSTQPIFGVNHFQIAAEPSGGPVKLYWHALSKLRNLRVTEVKKTDG